MLEAGKPVIPIYIGNRSFEYVNEIEAGIEEEGVPSKVHHLSDAVDATVLAKEAAVASIPGVGIGIGEDGICLHAKIAQKPFIIIDIAQCSRARARAMGSNAARAAKGLPFRNG